MHKCVNKSGIIKRYVIILMIGLIVGMIICLFLKTDYVRQADYFTEEGLDKIQSFKYNKKQILSMLFYKRIIFVLVFSIVGITSFGKRAIDIFMLIKSGCFGLLLIAYCKCLGIKGLLLFFVMTIPHIPIYIIGFFVLYKNIYFMCEKTSRKKDKTTQYLRYFSGLLLIEVIFFCGILLETYVNPLMTRGVIKIF